ncbi:MAG: NUDIX hydrolase [Anaerolineae bacterium]
MGKEVTIASERIYEGRLIGLRVDTVRPPGRRVAHREVVDSVAIVALDEAKNLLLVRQYRKPTEKELFEIPAGTLEEGEEPESCARRELQEETGYVAGSLERLCGFYPTPGHCEEYIQIYLAQGLEPSGRGGEADETYWFSWPQVLEMIDRGEIEDAKTIIGLLVLWARSDSVLSPGRREQV